MASFFLKVYVLKTDLPELTALSPEDEEIYLSRIDSRRKQLALRMKNNPKGRAATIGAGLLIQHAMREFDEGSCRENGEDLITVISLKELLSEKAEVTDYAYRYGEMGKPYFVDERLPFFNLSHAGGLVILAVSDREVGADIQNMRSQREKNMAERFFSGEESRAVSEDETREVFYKLWSRKEALGKCTGEGVRPYFSRSMLELDSSDNSKYTWIEERVYDCFLTVCVS